MRNSFKRFKRSLFGYKREQVERYIEELQQKTPDDKLLARMNELAEENVKLAVELKVARSGYVDVAELMQAAQVKAIQLEYQLSDTKQQIEELNRRIEETECTPAQDGALLSLLEEYRARVTELEKANSASLYDFLGDIKQFETARYKDGTVIEAIAMDLPAGMESVLNEASDGGARGLMHRIYKIRASAADESNAAEKDKME